MSNVLRESPVTRGAPVRATPRPPSDEIDLLAYAGTCWHYRYIVLAVVAVVAAATYVINRNIPPTYEVSFRLLASASKVGDPAGSTVSVAAFRELLQSQSMAAALLDEFKLTSPPYNLTAQRFLADYVTIRLIPDTTIIDVAVRFKDRDLFVRVANRYAEKAVDLAQRLNVGEGEYATQMIRQELDSASKRLAAADQALRQFQHRTQIELLRTDADALLRRRPEAADLTVQIEGERGRLRQSEAELAKQDRVRDVPRAVSSVAPLQPLPTAPPPSPQTSTSPLTSRSPSTSASTPTSQRTSDANRGSRDTNREQPDRTSSTSPESAVRPTRERPAVETSKPAAPPAAPEADPQFRPELLDPYVNPVYEVLQRDIANSRARLAGLEEQRRELVSRLKVDAPAAETLNRLYEAEAGLTALTRDFDVARTAYLNAATRHDEARLQITVRSPRLQILDQALPPDHAVAPRTLRNVAAASLMALTVMMMAVLIFDARRNRLA